MKNTPLSEAEMQEKESWNAKKILERNGYYAINLWHIDDVKEFYECDDETAKVVLHMSLTHQGIISHIWDRIDYISSRLKLKKI